MKLPSFAKQRGFLLNPSRFGGGGGGGPGFAVGTSAQGSASSTTTATTSSITTQSSGSTFLVGVVYTGGIVVNTPTDSKGNTYTAIGSFQSNNTDMRCHLFGCSNGTGGASHTATGTIASSGNLTVYLLEITGAATSSIDSASNAAAPDAATPYTVTSGAFAQANTIVVTLFGCNSTSTPTFACATGYTVQQSNTSTTSNWPSAIATKLVAATTAETASWTTGVAGDATMKIVGIKGP